MITLGDIFEKPKVELFHSAPNSKFYNSCREREKEIKKTIRQAFKTFNVHVLQFDKNKGQLPKWKKEWMTLCMTNLGNYLEDLIIELDKKKIEDYCRLEEKLGERYISFMPDMILLIINSYHGAVETDLHWVTDLTISDSIDIAIGDFDFNKLEKYLPKRSLEIKSLINELNKNNLIIPHLGTIEEAFMCFESNHIKASNLLLITVIEGLVRSLGIRLADKQDLTVNPTDKRKYASLDSFLNKIPWKKDLPIDEIRYGLITGNYLMNNKLKQERIIINLAERVGFLCRRFKENRNTILHGEETNYANSLNSFLNFSSLKEVLLTIKEYTIVYPK